MLKNPIGSATMEAVMMIYKCGKIEIRLPTRATNWLPIVTMAPKVERHIDGFYFVFENASVKELDDNHGLLK